MVAPWCVVGAYGHFPRATNTTTWGNERPLCKKPYHVWGCTMYNSKIGLWLRSSCGTFTVKDQRRVLYKNRLRLLTRSLTMYPCVTPTFDGARKQCSLQALWGRGHLLLAAMLYQLQEQGVQVRLTEVQAGPPSSPGLWNVWDCGMEAELDH